MIKLKNINEVIAACFHDFFKQPDTFAVEKQYKFVERFGIIFSFSHVVSSAIFSIKYVVFVHSRTDRMKLILYIYSFDANQSSFF